MNKFKTCKLKFMLLPFLLVGTLGFSQQTMRHTERFNVDKDVVIDLSTTHTDIEFETWDKNEVVVEAIFEMEDVSKEEAEKYFKKWDFEAKGNSKEVEVRSNFGGNLFFSGNNNFVIADMPNVNIQIPDINFDYDFDNYFELESLEPLAELAYVMPMPPMPPMPFNSFNFDYDRYKDEGDKYLDEWKKEWKENFDEEWEQEMKEWKEEMEERKQEIAKRREEMKVKREKMKLEREKLRKEREVVRKKQQEERAKLRKELRKVERKQRKNNSFIIFSGDGDKGLKIKKTIKIKMPKGAKLKMNVRHGEVKLAQNLKNIKATLSHTRLLADVIDGEHTDIEASYSPVLVNNWNYGRLKVNHERDILLRKVNSLKLTSNSSDVIIENLVKNSIINGNFGKLQIENINDNFDSLDIILENTDALLVLPSSSFDVYVSGANTRMSYPENLKVTKANNYGTQVVKGYNRQRNSNRTININAKYSEVVMQ